MTGAHRRVGDLLVIALMALGLIGMHHLVVAACSPTSIVATTAAPATHASHTGDPGSVDHRAPEPSPASDLGATCLAILVLAGALVSASFTTGGRVGAAAALPSLRAWFERALPPPDLTVLSISRT